MKKKKEKIVTKRLTIASIEDKDKESLILLCSNPLIKKTYMLPDFNNKEDEDRFFNKIKDISHSDEHYTYGVFLNDNLIGFFNDVNFDDNEIEVGYFISPEHWNHGYASEVLRVMIKELFRIGFNKVVAAHFEDNIASGCVMEKCGMTKVEKTEVIEYRDEKHKCIYYEIVKPRENDFALERRLALLDKKLHKKFTDVVFSMPFILSNYKKVFPNFTDHAIIHSLNVIEFCNKIIGDQINKLNADEIYSILLGCYLHDTGMGVGYRDYHDFSKEIDFKNYFDTHDRSDIPSIIRNFHHEYSGLFIKKYAHFLELPSEEHLFAIVQIARGHRKLDLEDRKEFPIDLKVPNGNTICLPYLASLVRLADEIDVTAARNCMLDVNYKNLKNEIDLLEFMKHDAIKDLVVTEKEFIMLVDTDNKEILKHLTVAANKMQQTLDNCRKAVNGVTPFIIKQVKIVIKNIEK